MNSVNGKTKKDIGYKGENFVIDKLKTCGFDLYKKNIKYIDSELDIVVYKYDRYTNNLDIRIVEVKTRNRYCFDLATLNLIRKWNLARKYIFKIKSELDSIFNKSSCSHIHFDLALVKYDDDKFFLYSYIKDVNLIL